MWIKGPTLQIVTAGAAKVGGGGHSAGLVTICIYCPTLKSAHTSPYRPRSWGSRVPCGSTACSPDMTWTVGGSNFWPLRQTTEPLEARQRGTPAGRATWPPGPGTTGEETGQEWKANRKLLPWGWGGDRSDGEGGLLHRKPRVSNLLNLKHLIWTSAVGKPLWGGPVFNWRQDALHSYCIHWLGGAQPNAASKTNYCMIWFLVAVTGDCGEIGGGKEVDFKNGAPASSSVGVTERLW